MIPLLLETLLLISTFFCLCSLPTIHHFKQALKLNAMNAGLLLIITLCLLISFLQDNFQFVYIATHSHSNLPWFLKISALWSGQSGSTLLFFLFSQGMLTLYFFLDSSYLKQKSQKILTKILILEIILMNIYLLSSDLWTTHFLFSSKEGEGLNPLLKDFAMTYHPPLLLFGQAGFFTLTWITHVGGNQKIFWLKVFMKITLGILTLGITFGSIWAYHVLGWGGYWFWDPVETLSLIPWIMGFAVLHALKENVSIIPVIWLSILLSLMVIRSNSLVSVHAFGQNIQNNSILIMLFISHFLISFKKILHLIIRLSKKSSLFIQKRQSLVFSSLFTLSMILLLGIFMPILISLITEQSQHLGPQFYTETLPPLIISVLAFISLKPQFSKKIKILLTLFFFFTPILWKETCGILIIILIILSYYLKVWRKQQLIHFLLYLALLSIALNVHYRKNYEILLEYDQKITLDNFEITPQNSFKEKGTFGTQDLVYPLLVSYRDFFGLREYSIMLYPRQQIHLEKDLWTSKMDFISHTLEEYGFILGEQRSETQIYLKIYYNPFLNFIWLPMIILGIIITFQGLQGFIRSRLLSYNHKRTNLLFKPA